MRESFNLDEEKIEKIGIMDGIIINMVVEMIGIKMVLMKIGFKWEEMKRKL